VAPRHATDPNRFRYVSTHAPGTYVEVRSASGAVVGPTVPAYQRGGEHASPALPKTITGFTKDAQGQSSLLFTAPSAQAGGAPFRVLAVQRLDGDTLILGISLADTNSTLHRLLLIEIAVALGALLTAALVGGGWSRSGSAHCETSRTPPRPSPRASSLSVSRATTSAPRSDASHARST